MENTAGKWAVRRPAPLNKVKIDDRFWGRYIGLVLDEVIPYQWEILNDRVPGAEPSHAIENFRIAAGLAEGKFHGYVFQDSDVAKWLEAVAYKLSIRPDEALERTADEVIELIGKAQQPDGYLDTYFTVEKPDMRWTDERRKHELYCAGHLIEAAVAYYEATHKRPLLDIVCRLADHIDSVFGSEDGKKKGYPGHQVIEMALVRLYHATGEERYLKLAKFFIDERGKQPHFFDIEASERGERDHSDYFGEYTYAYTQSHLPVREQKEAVGHAVRAVYLYSGMADVAAETGDEELAQACRVLWDNMTNRRMYVTGGIGSSEYGEDFTFDYDLPNDTMYAETCASIGLVFFARRMLAMELDSKYGDEMERALYNGILSGMSLDGRKFFYVNPMEVWPERCEKRHDLKHVEPERQPWFSCACCPPNLARLIASFGSYIYSSDSGGVQVHLYAGSTYEADLNGKKVFVGQKTDYPWDGTVTITVDAEEPVEFAVSLRIPGWCREARLAVNGEAVDVEAVSRRGYAVLKRLWKKGDSVTLTLPMQAERVLSNPKVRANAGKVALQRGPVVYCLEEADNGENLSDIALPKDSILTARSISGTLGEVVILEGEALRSDPSGWDQGQALYRPAPCKHRVVHIKAVPYCMWGNRKAGEMLVWLREA